MTETNPEADGLSEPLRAAELEKINLEIRLLKTTGGVNARTLIPLITALVPLITAFVAVCGLMFAILQFTNEQQKDRRVREADTVIKVQEQIRTDVEQLLRFPTDERQTVAASLFLLDDLENLLGFPVSGNQKTSDIYPEQKRDITKGLERLVEDDCNLGEKRDAAFALALFDGWNDYGDYLKKDYSEEDLTKVEFILFKYTRAFQTLRDKDPEFFKRIHYNPDSKRYEPTGEVRVFGAAFDHYVDLEAGFRRHLDVLGPDPKAREEFIRAFQIAVCNSTLTLNRFGVSYSDIKDCSDQAATGNP